MGHAWIHSIIRAHLKRIKVFWFFFSKKNFLRGTSFLKKEAKNFCSFLARAG